MMSEKRFKVVQDPRVQTEYFIYDNENKISRNITDYPFINQDVCSKIVMLLNKQQSLIGRLQEENLYKNFELKSVDDLKKLKNIFEICMILIEGAIADEDLELGYESVFQFERRIKKFNGD